MQGERFSPPTGKPYSREEARARLRQAASRFDLESADWAERHPYETFGLALMVGWLMARYPRLRRLLARLLVGSNI